MSVFEVSNFKSHLKRNMFFDESVDIARYDKVKYSQLEKLTEMQQSFFWRPQEVNISKDSRDFKTLHPASQSIFTLNLRRQILLDSVQGRAPVLAFLPICSLPELENFILAWTFFETIHSRSYSHIIKNIYPNPSEVFDEMLDIEEIVDCATDISHYYDRLIELNNHHDINGYNSPNEKYEHKKALWLTLNSVNALEGIRFYASFACSWAFGENKQMEGNANIIKLIARDENIHLAATQQILKLLVREDPDFAKIKEETEDKVLNIFMEVIEQERAWARFIFKEGSMIGLNESLLIEYVEWIAHKRMIAIGIDSPLKGGSNPLPWTQKWISGSEVQAAAQETDLNSYTVGAIKRDIDEDTFKGFTL